ncbi:phage tail tape measure protein [Microbacteriaceae bacterium VKM Ac-2855]|nr:phage tail tape measure protein [Microbacteriaceae bacterium VKM Ac-2855]
MTDRTVKVTAVFQAQQYIAGLEQMKKKTREVSTDGTAAIEQQKQAYETLGHSVLAIGGFATATVALAISKFAEFDAAMSEVQASTSASTKEMGSLRGAAIQAGADTAFSATEAANAINELSKAGVSTTDILSGGLTGALDLASAGGLGVARAAEISATALGQFQLKGSDAAHVADVLAAGAGKAMGSVDDLAQGMKFVGPIANSMGVSLEETTGVMALFAQQGVVGSEAGTSFRAVLSALTSPSQAARKEMERLGIQLYDLSTGAFLGVENAAGELSDAYRTMDGASRDASLGTIFGAESVVAATALYQAGSEGVAEWTEKVNDSGFASEQAAMKLDNLKGDIDALGGSVDTALIKSGSAANDTLRFLTQAATDAVNAFSGMPGPVQGGALAVGALGAASALAAGAFLTAVPRVAAYNAAIGEMTPGVQRASRAAIGLGKAVGAVAALATAGVILDKIASSGDKAAAGLEATTNALLKDNTGALFKGLGADVNSYGEALRLLTADDLNSSMERLGSNINGFFGGQFTDQVAQSRDQLDTMGQSLAALVQGGQADKAAALFDQLASKAKEQGVSTEELTKLMPAYAEALSGVANEQELATGSATDAADAYLAQAGEVENLQDQLSKLIEQINKTNGVNQDAIGANADYQAALAGISEEVEKQKDAYEKANGSLDGYSFSMDTSTEAGSANAKMFSDLAAQSQAAAEAQLAADHNADGYLATVNAGKQTLIDQITSLTGNADAAQQFADRVYEIPSKAEVDAIMRTADAVNAIDVLRAKIDAIPREVGVNITTTNVVTYSDARNSAGRADGGAIYGPGGPRDDKAGLFRLSNGEHVLDAEDVARMGGQSGVYAFRRALYQGLAGGFADGGAIYSRPWEAPNLAPDPRNYAPMPAHYTTHSSSSSTTVAPSVNLNGTFYSYDPTQLTRDADQKMRRTLTALGIGRGNITPR